MLLAPASLPAETQPMPQPPEDRSRRQFLTALAAAGFAAAVRPISADTILTPADGLDADMDRVAVGDGFLPVYRASPQGRKDLPLILVVQEIFGVHEHIRDICRRLARLGYCAVAPELYFRQGDPSKIEDIPTLLKTLVAFVPDEQVMRDLDTVVRWAQGTGRYDGRRLGITGFCWGGRIVWLYCAHNPQVKAGVAWYGRLEGEATAMTPEHPIDIADTLEVPVLGLYGGQDAGIPQDSVARMRSKLNGAHSQSEIILYPDAPHAFNADYRPSYRKAAAEDGWRRMREWFAVHGANV